MTQTAVPFGGSRKAQCSDGDSKSNVLRQRKKNFREYHVQCRIGEYSDWIERVPRATATTDCVNVSDVSSFNRPRKLTLNTRVNMHFRVRLHAIYGVFWLGETTRCFGSKDNPLRKPRRARPTNYLG